MHFSLSIITLALFSTAAVLGAPAAPRADIVSVVTGHIQNGLQATGVPHNAHGYVDRLSGGGKKAEAVKNEPGASKKEKRNKDAHDEPDEEEPDEEEPDEDEPAENREEKRGKEKKIIKNKKTAKDP